MNRRRNRRLVAGVVLVALALLGTDGMTAARSATPAAAPGTAAFPVLRITATTGGFTVPARVTAGRYLVVLDNTSKHPVGTSILALPGGVSVGDVQAAFARLPDVVPPKWYYQTRMPGAPDVAPPGQQTRVILDFIPGRYVVISSDPPAPPAATFDVVAVSNGTPSFAPTPDVDARITEVNFAFPGLPTRVAPGHHIWQVTNASNQPHMLDLSRVPVGTTLPQAIAALAKPAAGTPASGGMSMANFAPAGGLMLLSPGQTGWAVLDLAPGHYLAVCSVPDAATDKPHFLLGMIGLFDVGASPSATPASTPAAARASHRG